MALLDGILEQKNLHATCYTQ